eukprot:6182707-Pleurochrysis_carterae.AAC.1
MLRSREEHATSITNAYAMGLCAYARTSGHTHTRARAHTHTYKFTHALPLTTRTSPDADTSLLEASRNMRPRSSP